MSRTLGDISLLSDASELEISFDDDLPHAPVRREDMPCISRDPNLSLTPEPVQVKQVRFGPSVAHAPPSLANKEAVVGQSVPSEDSSAPRVRVFRYKATPSSLDAGEPPVVHVHRNAAPLVSQPRPHVDAERYRGDKSSSLRLAVLHEVNDDDDDDDDDDGDEEGPPSCRVEAPLGLDLGQPRAHTTEKLAGRINAVEQSQVNARGKVEERLRASPELRQQLTDKTSEVLNIDEDEQLFPNLIELEVPVRELIDRLGRERERLRRPEAKIKPDLLPEPDPMEFFSETMVHQAADFSLRLQPDLLPGLALAPRDNDTALYRQYCEEQGLL